MFGIGRIPFETLKDKHVRKQLARGEQLRIGLFNCDLVVFGAAMISDNAPVDSMARGIACLLADRILPVDAKAGVDVMIARKPHT